MTGAKKYSHSQDLVGMRFGKLLVLAQAPKGMIARTDQKAWICACDCSGFTVRATSRLTSRQVSSCGCKAYKAEVSKRAKKAVAKRFQKPSSIPAADPFNFFFGRQQ